MACVLRGRAPQETCPSTRYLQPSWLAFQSGPLRTAGAAQAPTSHLVCSFSVLATEENVAEKPILQDWRDDARRRFAAQTYWQLERMSVETRVHEHVVL